MGREREARLFEIKFEIRALLDLQTSVEADMNP